MQAHLIAQLPLPVHFPEEADRDVSVPENDAKQSAGGSLSTAKNPSIPLLCRVVRHVPEGMCLDFVHRSAPQRRELEDFLVAVQEKTRAADPTATEGNTERPANDPIVRAAPKDNFWWAPGCPVEMHLALEVVQRLRQRLWNMGAGNSDEGLLFGRTWDGGTEILDFQSAANASMTSVIAGLTNEGRRSLIGYYRTEEAGDLRLNAKDLSLAEECFAEPCHVFLLVHTDGVGPRRAAFFCHGENGRMQAFATNEFAFNPVLLAISEHNRIQKSQGSAKERPVEAISPSTSASPATNDRREKLRFLTKAVGMWFNYRSVRGRNLPRADKTTAGSVAATRIPTEADQTAPPRTSAHGTHQPIRWALIAIAILMLAIAWILNRGSHAAAVSTSAQSPLGLHVVSRGNQLEIHWNHDAAPVRNAAKGVMRISDGDVQEVVEFDATQIRDGALAYSPKTNDVSVRLEVNAVDGTSASESIRSVAMP